MLGGLSPILIIGFYKLIPKLNINPGKIPVVSDLLSSIPLVPIPIYLDEGLTGVYIDSESKSVDIETDTETLSDGGFPVSNQKGLSSLISISAKANKDSIGLNILTALIDQIFTKVTSKEYSITYVNNGILIFNGLLHNFSVTQSADNDLFQINMQISGAPSNGTQEAKKIPTLTPQGTLTL